MTNTTEQTDPSHSDAINDLECALTEISGLADVLCEMGKHRGGDAAAYIGNRLREHYQQAHAAFCIVSGLGRGGAA